MKNTRNIIIISDIHLAAERNRGLFRADDELADFLSWFFEERKDSVLILNGDVLDFLVGESGSNTISIGDASRKVEKIIENHPEVFDALSKIANSSNHQLIIVSGNHDPELANPFVQAKIENRLKGENFSPNIRWVTGGHALLTEISDQQILIEHGDLFDDFNRIDYEELNRTTAHISRVLEFDGYKPPAGSDLVESLSELRQKYLWIDYIKPLSIGTFPLIWAFANQEPNSRQAKMFVKVIRDGIGGSTNFIVRKIKELIGASPFLGEEDAFPSSNQLFTDWREKELRSPTFLSEKNLEELIRRLKEVSLRDRSFDVESMETNSLKNKCLKQYAAKKQVSAVVHGHTHSAKNCIIENGNLLYLNSGTWGQLLQLPQKDTSEAEWKKFLRDLESGIDNSFKRLTFIQLGQNGKLEATVNQWLSTTDKELFDSSANSSLDGKYIKLSASYLDKATNVWQREK